MKGAENEKQGSKMEVNEATPGMQPSSNETHGGFVMCEVEERQEACVEVQGPRRGVTRVKLWQSVRKKQREWVSCQAPLVNHVEKFIGVTIDAVKRPSDVGR